MRNYLSSLAQPRQIVGKGFGSFAIQTIPAGSIVATFGGSIITRSDFQKFPAEQRSRSIQINTDLFVLGPETREPGDSINHSCSPNCGMRNATQLITMRDVAAGEELSYDYAMSDSCDYDEFDCGCGAPDCRKRVTGNDWQISKLQAQYGGLFAPYIMRKIRAAQLARQLSKKDVEQLLNNYDANPQSALVCALRIVTGMPDASWTSLIEVSEYDHATRERLLALDPTSLDRLAQLLNEQRSN